MQWSAGFVLAVAISGCLVVEPDLDAPDVFDPAQLPDDFIEANALSFTLADFQQDNLAIEVVHGPTPRSP